MAERSCSTLKFDGRRCCKRPKVFIKKSVAPQETPVACDSQYCSTSSENLLDSPASTPVQTTSRKKITVKP